MSSIISDIFYGSKQNLLDNYLLHRFEKEPSLSGPNPLHRTAVFSSALHFTISIPVGSDFEQKHYEIKVQLGKQVEQVMASVGGTGHTPEILVQLNDLEIVDMSKYSNIKITISEGKYKDKVFGYIPIQTIKSMKAQQGSSKTLVLPLKGKRLIGFSSIKCTIKADFSQKILESNILGSVEKDNSGHSQLNFRSRENEIQEMSGIQEHSLQKSKNSNKYNSLNRRSNNKLRNQSESYMVEDYSNLKSRQNRLRSANQFIKEILPVSAIFSIVKLNNLNHTSDNIKLTQNGFTFNLGQQVKLSNITQHGVNVDIYADDSKIGTAHLNALFLTMAEFRGEQPIYNQKQQFVGTILVSSPIIRVGTENVSWKQNRGRQAQTIRIEELLLEKQTFVQRQMKNLIVISIKKIMMTNLSKELIDGSLDNINQLKAEFFDFVKMEACGRLELIVRINHQTFRFNDISLRYIIDSDQIQVVQLRRRQGFLMTSCQQTQSDRNTLEIELYSNHRLLSYSKSTFGLQTTATHHFIAAKTNFAYSQSAIYCRYIQLLAPEEFFQVSRLSQIMNIIQQFVEGQFRLLDLSDDSIKQIMNINKKIAYVEVRKLFNLMQSHFNLFMAFQQTNIATVFGEQPHKNQLIAQINGKLLRQFALLDITNQCSIEDEEFHKIAQFFTNRTILEIQQSCDKLITNCIKNTEGRVLYPFFVAGLYLHHQSVNNQQQSQSNTNEPIIIHQPPQLFKEVFLRSQQRFYIQSIQFHSLHLLNFGKIPNAVLNISKKIHYSNANPQFIIEKQISAMQPIKIYHKNIAQNTMQLLAEFTPMRKRSLYQIDVSSEVTATIVWGNEITPQ